MSTPVEIPAASVGQVLAGKYRVERVVGAGGMGVVVAAHHLQLDQRVALKFLLPQALANPEVVARFDREARAAVRIKSEHVARVIDVGKLENGAPYMVMEYLEGGDLAAWLDHRGPLPIAQAVDFVMQACEAIAEAHALGIVHRDLKPANLFCIRRPDGLLSIKVLDFGISKLLGMGSSSDMGMTRTATLVGSPFYMSPEQMHSAKGVDPRTDLWSLGVILFELLTNRLPFEADEMPELIIKVLRDPPPSLVQLRPDVPPALEAVVMRCLEKARDQRWPDVGQLAQALVEFGPARARVSLEVVSGIVQGSAQQRGTFSVQSPVSERVAVSPRAVPTVASWAGTGATTKQAATRRGVAWVPVGVAGGVLALGAVGAALAWSPWADRPVRPGEVALVTGRDASPIPAKAGSVVDTAPVVATLLAGADAGAESDAEPARDAGTRIVAPPLARRDAGGWAWQPPPQPPPPNVDCRVPYFYDAQGNKVFKLGCLP